MKAHKHQWVCADCGESKATPAPRVVSLKVAPASSVNPSSAKAIEGLTVRLATWTRQFDRENPKAVSAGDNTVCKSCARPLKLGRILPFHIGSKTVGYAHYACAPWIHPAACPCLSCANRRARAGKPLMFTGVTKMLPPQNMEQLLGQKIRVRVSAFSSKAVLRLCACGHPAGTHSEDELQNLLECFATGCSCDHFHYQTETVPAAAGA